MLGVGLEDGLFMPGTPALHVNGYWKAGNVGGEYLNMNCQSRDSAAVAHGSDAQVIDSLENFPF